MINAITTDNAHKTGPKPRGTHSAADRKRAARNTEHREETKCQLMNQRASCVQSVARPFRRGA